MQKAALALSSNTPSVMAARASQRRAPQAWGAASACTSPCCQISKPQRGYADEQ